MREQWRALLAVVALVALTTGPCAYFSIVDSREKAAQRAAASDPTAAPKMVSPAHANVRGVYLQRADCYGREWIFSCSPGGRVETAEVPP